MVRIVALFSAVGLVLSAGIIIPRENREKGTPPPVENAAAGAKQLLEALKHNAPELGGAFFFPEDAFDLLKDASNPRRYHQKLKKWYTDDIKNEHPRFKNGNWQFEKLTLGRCRWKAVGAEANKLPYWSCIGNFVTATDGKKRRRFEIRVLINWGEAWYVTHLGPIRH